MTKAGRNDRTWVIIKKKIFHAETVAEKRSRGPMYNMFAAMKNVSWASCLIIIITITISTQICSYY